ncbi:hypothetical protein ABVK25_010191 [Lepraria finkii]|uniref:Uncharacterized protein n=1 Tax=Lepraria finkii TaxID=1340010 RepID=A0ABR4AXW0_9LECA
MTINCVLASTAVNLKLSCRTLYQCGPALPIVFYLARKDPDLRFDLSCISQRKFKKHKGQLACSGCRTFHHPSVFPPEQLQNEDWQRRCDASRRYLRITPDSRMSYQELISNLPRLPRPPIACLSFASYRLKTFIRKHQSAGPSQSHPYTEHPRVMLQRNKADLFLRVVWAIYLDPLPGSTAPIEALVQQLSKCPVNLCCHIRSDDRYVAEESRKLQSTFRSSDWGDKLDCPNCGMEIKFLWRRDFFDRQESPRGIGIVNMYLKRRLGRSAGYFATDPQWISQSEL